LKLFGKIVISRWNGVETLADSEDEKRWRMQLRPNLIDIESLKLDRKNPLSTRVWFMKFSAGVCGIGTHCESSKCQISMNQLRLPPISLSASQRNR